ncbi:Neurochondrin-domain-containing protein [Rhypophila decipiens]|uniref:Neurochondrin-domain-containing protein n=1 Tax=Rhypophila decipiens TaxID=261697 RepID=A0AAN6Y8B5_9PEZI|nr:Neurochondrin-domain-containing protein [Rhypophila decipiens]
MNMDQATNSQPSQEVPPGQDQFNVQKIQALLTAKDDTSRFVGLALLKSLLDNSEQVRQDVNTMTAVWQTISPKFLDRLIKTGSQTQNQNGGGKQGQEMLDLAVSVLHTFITLLPAEVVRGKRAIGRIPHLVACLLHCSEETTRLVLETLLTLVSQPDGAQEFNQVEDLTPLTEIASSHQLVLKILEHAWLGGMLASSDKTALKSKLNKTVGNLVTSFKGTDAVTLLEFLSELLRSLDPEDVPQNPEWLPTLRTFIQGLVKSRPTAEGRAAWTNITATLLQLYPTLAPDLLFLDHDKGKSKAKDSDTAPFSYVLISLLLVDLRASLPSLLEKLNSPEYKPVSTRLSSAYTILSNFIGYLLTAADAPDESLFTTLITPDLLLKLRKSISETMSLTIEYLRDRYDASVAGAQGLHPDSRTRAVHTSTGSHLPLTWDSKGDNITEDPLIESAIMALAIWLREDDGEVLRLEATGLMDMFVELYRNSSHPANAVTSKQLDFRRPILAALEGTILTSINSDNPTGVESFLENKGWQVLSSDLLTILNSTSSYLSHQTSAVQTQQVAGAASRGLEIIRILLPLAESKEPAPQEEWLDLVTKISSIYIPPPPATQSVGADGTDGEIIIIPEFQIAALQLSTSLLERSHRGIIQKRYRHTIAALVGIAEQVNSWLLMLSSSSSSSSSSVNTEKGGGDNSSGSNSLFEALDEVRLALSALQGGL